MHRIRKSLIGCLLSVVFSFQLCPAVFAANEYDELITFFDDSKVYGWSSGYTDENGLNDYVAEVIDSTCAKEGKASYRLKLVTARYEKQPGDDLTMLYVNIVNSSKDFGYEQADFSNMYLSFWYQPLLKREKTEVGFACGSKPYASLRVDLMDYVTVDDSEYGSSTVWKEVKIPLSDFLDSSKAVFDSNGTGLSEFDWSRFAGFSFAGSDENVPQQTNFVRLDSIKIVREAGQTAPEPEPSVSPSSEPEEELERLITFFDDTKVDGWSAGYTDAEGHNDYISEIVDSGCKKNGTASYRIKLKTPYYVKSASDDLTMLYVNIVRNPYDFGYSKDQFGNMYLKMWYQPLLKRKRTEVGFVCGSKPYASLRVNLLDYVTVEDSEYGNDTVWKEVKIPLSDFLDSSKAVFDPNGTGLTSFDWSRFVGFSVAGTDEDLEEQTNFLRLDDICIEGNIQAPTATPTSTPTSKPTSTPTSTPVSTPTSKPTSTPTSTPTLSPTPPPTPVDSLDAQGQTENSFFVDDKVGWSNTYTDEQLRGGYISEVIDKTVKKEGTASYRIKIMTPYGVNTDLSDLNMLFVNVVNSPKAYIPDMNNSYLELWYQPLLKRERVEIGFACGSEKPYASLRVNLMDYITISDSEYGKDNVWKKVKIPLADFFDDTKTIFAQNGSAYASFDWNRFAGFSIAASDENIPDQVNFCRMDDIKTVKYIGEPSALAVTGKTAQSVSLSWAAPNTAADGYYIYRDGIKVGQTSALQYTDTGLMGDHEYTYWVQAYSGSALSGGIEIKVTTDGYFDNAPSSGVYFDDISYYVNEKPVTDYTLEAGELKTEASICMNSDTASAYAVSAVYGGNLMKSISIKPLVRPESGESIDFSVHSYAEAGDCSDIFIVNNLRELKPLTPVYRISADGYCVIDAVKNTAAVSGVTAAYSPQTHNIILSLTGTGTGYINVLITGAQTDMNNISAEDILFAGNVRTADGAQSISVEFDSASFDEGEYTAYIYSGSGSIKTDNFYYATDTTIQSLIDILNDETSGEAIIEQTLMNKALALDTADFEELSAENRLKVCSYFKQYRTEEITEPAGVEAVYKKALAAVIFAGTVKTGEGCALILKYAEQLGVSSVFTDGIRSTYSTEVKNGIDSLMSDAAVEYKKLSDPAENAVSRIETVCILAALNDPELTWNGMKTLLSDTYKDYSIADLNRINNSGLAESSIYKELLGKTYKSFAAVDKAIDDAVKKLSQSSGKPSGGGGGGGGGSSSGTGGFVDPGAGNTPKETPAPQEIYFKDTQNMTWAYESVKKLAEKGAVAYADEFRPNDNITREEFVKIVVEAFGLMKDGAQCSYSDVAESSWSYPYIASAAEAGIINGTGDSRFGAQELISRQDISCILYRIMQLSADTNAEFDDADDISPYAKEPVAAMKAAGIIKGYSDNSFRPKSFASRAEAAVMICRAAQM